MDNRCTEERQHTENSYNHRKSSEQNHILQQAAKANIQITYCKVETQALAAPGVSAQRK
jgi:hypothetical protein